MRIRYPAIIEKYREPYKTSRVCISLLNCHPEYEFKIEGFRLAKRSSFTVPEKIQKLNRICALKGYPFGFFNIQKLKEGPLGDIKIFQKKSHGDEKTERGPFSLARYCMLR